MVKTKNEKAKRWDLAIGGTNSLPPLGTKAQPRPEWLPNDFVTPNILQSDPIDLRDELFLGRDPKFNWNILSNLLHAIEKQATKVLEDDERQYIDCLTERLFHNFYCLQQESNTPKQANAIAALRSIEVIRSLTNTVDNRGVLVCDPDCDHTYDSGHSGQDHNGNGNPNGGRRAW